MAGYEALDALVERLTAAAYKDRDAIKEELLREASAHADRSSVLEHLESAKRGIDELELRWEVDEVIEALTPEPEPEPEEPEPEPEEPEQTRDGQPGQLTAADLDMVYHDPSGLVLHKTKVGDRWFATQTNPRTGQPQMFELHPSDVQQLKVQLAGSPYWMLGAGA
ncbi:MAG: hypothetical protein KTR31_03265 [Myxococcales bacterium]|nr:hypothetical protein [Myxococcales bacterium]